nr:MAG TPA: hypothetical protein [Podoviridae sp. ctY3D12]
MVALFRLERKLRILEIPVLTFTPQGSIQGFFIDMPRRCLYERLNKPLIRLTIRLRQGNTV